jgi:hypothetical protein
VTSVSQLRDRIEANILAEIDESSIFVRHSRQPGWGDNMASSIPSTEEACTEAWRDERPKR